MASFIPKFLRQLRDVVITTPADTEVLTYDAGTGKWVNAASTGGGGGAPDDVNYLVGTASGDLSAEIVVGTTPGGELGNTWASPTVDTTHSGSSHASIQSAAEATAAAALAAHEADTTNVHGIANTANLQPLDSDLTAIAALTTTAFGRGLLELANQAALLSAAGAAAASHVHAGEDITSGTVADARIASTIARDSEVTSAISALSTVYQPLDSDLTAIAALTTTTYGRALLTQADEAAFKATVNLEAGTDFPSLSTFNDHSARHEDGGADEISIAGLSGTSADLSAHLSDSSAAHAGSAISFSPTGTIAATDVQAAIAEVASEAAGASGAMTRITQIVVGSGGSATIDFTSIAGIYESLVIKWVAQTENASAENLVMRFNNDSGGNYTWGQADVMAGGTANAGGQTSGVIGVLPATGDTNPSLGEIRINGYARTVFTKVARGEVHGFYSGSHRMPLSHTFWNNTAAITRVTLFAASDVKEGSVFTLYGIT